MPEELYEPANFWFLRRHIYYSCTMKNFLNNVSPKLKKIQVKPSFILQRMYSMRTCSSVSCAIASTAINAMAASKELRLFVFSYRF